MNPSTRFLKASALLFFLLSSVLACASPGVSTFRYETPKANDSIKNEVIINRPFSEVWDSLVGELAKSFFVINNIEKVSRIINVSFSTDKPEKYADCGTSERTFKYGEDSQTYTYPLAGSNTYKATGTWAGFRPLLVYAERKASLEGRINIYVAPKENDTIVTVNSRYILTVRTSGEQHFITLLGQIFQRSPIPEHQSAVAFSTAQSGSASWGTVQERFEVTCRATGLLESQVLSMPAR